MRRLNCLGLKSAICCCVLSAWGIIQLGSMGVFFHVRSLAFLDDVPEAFGGEASRNLTQFFAQVERGYDASAFNCWMGASFYCLLLLFSLCQCAINYWLIQNGKTEPASPRR